MPHDLNTGAWTRETQGWFYTHIGHCHDGCNHSSPLGWIHTCSVRRLVIQGQIARLRAYQLTLTQYNDRAGLPDYVHAV